MTTNIRTSYQTDCDISICASLETAIKNSGYQVTLTREIQSRQRFGVTIRTWETTCPIEIVKKIVDAAGVGLYGICSLEKR